MPDYKNIIKRRKRNAPVRNNVRKKSPPNMFLVKAVAWLMLAAIIIGLSYNNRSFLLNFPGFKIKTVSVITYDGKLVPRPDDYFKLNQDLYLFSFDMEKVNQDIRTRHPELAQVLIRKQFPNKLLIAVRPRKPEAVVSLRDLYLVDREGFVLPYNADYANLPKITGVSPKQAGLYAISPSLGLKKALSLIGELERANVYPEHQISQIDVAKYSDIVFFLKNKLEIRMGQGDFARKAILLRQVLLNLKPGAPIPQYVDLRFDDPIVKP